jgi:hypothetical protein
MFGERDGEASDTLFGTMFGERDGEASDTLFGSLHHVW